MDRLAARPPQVPAAQKQAPDLAQFVHRLVTGKLQAPDLGAMQRCAGELREAFRAAPPDARMRAFDDVFNALQRFAVPRGFCHDLAQQFVQHHGGQRLARYDRQAQTATDPATRAQLSQLRQVLARYVGAGPGPASPQLQQPSDQVARAARPPARMPEPGPAMPRPLPLPGDFVAPRRAPLPPGAAPMPRRADGGPQAAEPRPPGAPLRFPVPEPIVHNGPDPAWAPPANVRAARPPAASPHEVAARVDALVEGGPRLAATELRSLLDQLQRGDLPTALHTRAYLRLERASREKTLRASAAGAVDQFLYEGAAAQLERLQALAQAYAEGQDIGTIYLPHAINSLMHNGRLPESAASAAAELLRELKENETPKAVRSVRAPAAPPNEELARIASAVNLQGVGKAKTGAVLPARQGFAEVRVSALTGQNGVLLAHIASTAGRGSFAKFKPVVLADGRVMGARMMRTTAKYIGKNGENNTVQTPASNYLAERQALHAAGSRFAPTQSLVDDKGRIYDIVELTEGDAGALTERLTLAQRARVLPVALQDLLHDLGRLETQQMAHRDIKPANVMWQRDGTFGLGDYGLAHAGPVTGRRGTMDYLAPELLDGTADGRGKVDAYALGLTMVEMLLGAEGMRGFPLRWADSAGNDGREQADYIRQVHAEWTQARRSVPVRAMDPGAQALDLAYQQMVEAEPSVAQLVFNQLLNPNPRARPTAREALRQLNAQVPASRLARRPVGADLQAVSENSPYNQRVRESVALLQAERQRAIG